MWAPVDSNSGKGAAPRRFGRLPAANAGPLGLDRAARARNHVVALVLGPGRAGVVRQDADLGTDGQLRQRLRRAGADGESAVLLAGAGDDQIGIEPAIGVAD